MAGTGRAGSPLAHGASRVAQTAEGVNAPDTSRVLAPYTPRRQRRSLRFDKWQPTCPTSVEGCCLTDPALRVSSCRRTRSSIGWRSVLAGARDCQSGRGGQKSPLEGSCWPPWGARASLQAPTGNCLCRSRELLTTDTQAVGRTHILRQIDSEEVVVGEAVEAAVEQEGEGATGSVVACRGGVTDEDILIGVGPVCHQAVAKG